jgi:hypothetical protein
MINMPRKWTTTMTWLLLAFALTCAYNKSVAHASSFDAKRLYDDLLTGYNRLIRPVGNNSEKLIVYMGLKLTQILDVV